MDEKTRASAVACNTGFCNKLLDGTELQLLLCDGRCTSQSSISYQNHNHGSVLIMKDGALNSAAAAAAAAAAIDVFSGQPPPHDAARRQRS
jgi:hypothetical protein